MKKIFCLFFVAACGLLGTHSAMAQVVLGSADALLLPTTPSSADTLTLSLLPSANCPSTIVNPYQVSMSRNGITVTLNEGEKGVCSSTQPRPRRDIDLGRLPAGSYTLTVIAPAVGTVAGATLIDKAPFTIADARVTKAAPYVQADYSGHWWDPVDYGWGLFIWQDARNANDSLLAAWFTYAPDGKASWYVFQPKWENAYTTLTADLLQGARLPSLTSPPLTLGSFTVVGSAKLDFANFSGADQGKIIYTLNNGATLTRTIVRFRIPRPETQRQ